MKYTLTIIKPDAYSSFSQILQRIFLELFRIIAIKFTHLTKNQDEEFYSIHKDKPFYRDLINFMTSGPIVVCALQKNDAVDEFRSLIGDTDPKASSPGTIRSMYGTDISSNAIHGSDSDENAKKEILFFFPELISKF